MGLIRTRTVYAAEQDLGTWGLLRASTNVQTTRLSSCCNVLQWTEFYQWNSPVQMTLMNEVNQGLIKRCKSFDLLTQLGTLLQCRRHIWKILPVPSSEVRVELTRKASTSKVECLLRHADCFAWKKLIDVLVCDRISFSNIINTDDMHAASLKWPDSFSGYRTDAYWLVFRN